ncbi:MAG: nucleotide exchange factor GrpE [Candidatus Saccharimonadales bacterium]
MKQKKDKPTTDSDKTDSQLDYVQISEQLAAENAQLTEALQRERADAVNLRRQHEAQIAALRSSVKSNIVKDLLPIIDNFERALKHLLAAESQEPRVKSQEEKQLREWVEGVKKILLQFEKTLGDIGVERIKTVGEPFDPHYHEAVSMEQGEGEHEVVCEELQSGYAMGEDVIRHAMVRVKG